MKGYSIFFIISIFSSCLLFSSCDRGDEGLKIVIEDSIPSDTVAVDEPTDGDEISTADETEIDTGIIVEPDDVEIDPGIVVEPNDVEIDPGFAVDPDIVIKPGDHPVLKMDIFDVLSIASNDEDFSKITSDFPIKLIIAGRPQNSIWIVNLEAGKTSFLEIAIDDITGEVIRRDSDAKRLKNAVKEREGAPDHALLDKVRELSLGYRGALEAALEAEGVPPIDYGISLKVIIGVVPGGEGRGPVWEVVIAHEGERPLVFVLVDDSGSIISIREELIKDVKGEK